MACFIVVAFARARGISARFDTRAVAVMEFIIDVCSWFDVQLIIYLGCADTIDGISLC